MPCQLFDLIAQEGILLEFEALPPPLLGLYDNRPGDPPVIVIHKKNRHHRRLLRCILAEELGHHYTSAGNLMAFARSTAYRHQVMKQERAALWWATRRLIPLDKLVHTVNKGILVTYELAERFDVTERFMGTALRLYLEKRRHELLGWLRMLPEEINITA